MTTVDELLVEAASRAGLDDFGDEWFLQPLACFADDLDDGLLNDQGRAFMREQGIRDLVRRLRILDYIGRHPEIDDVEIPPIVYVTGQIRSGTTLLHNVLAQHESGRPLLRWELMEPLPPPETATYDHDPRIARIQASIDKRRGTQLEQMHWVNADEPEECQWAFIDFVSLLAGAAGACMRRWGAFVSTADLRRAFVHYRQLVKLLLWKHPVPPGGFLVLKAPQITSSIHSFADIFPEARFVAPVRDPYRVVVSGYTMVRDIVAPLVDPARWADDEGLEFMTASIGANVAAMLDFVENGGRIDVVDYPDVVSDPIGTASEIFESLEIPADPGLPKRVDEFLTAQRRGSRATPPTVLPDWGIDPEALRAREPFASLCERYGIEPERRRLTGTS